MSSWNIKDKWGDHTATSFPFPAAKGQSHWLCPAPHCHSPAVGNVCRDSLLPLWHSGCSGDSMMRLLSPWRSSKRRFPRVLFQWTQLVSRHWRFLKLAKKKKKKKSAGDIVKQQLSDEREGRTTGRQGVGEGSRRQCSWLENLDEVLLLCCCFFL